MHTHLHRRTGVPAPRLHSLILVLAGLLVLVGCNTRPATQGTGTNGFQDTVSIRYAQCFAITDYAPSVRLLTISNPEGKHATTYRYALVQGEQVPDSLPSDCQVLHLPLTRFICMTSLQLSNFIALGQTDRVVGITSTRHLFNEQMNRQLQEGSTVQIGIEGEFDNELILAADPQLILVSPSKRGGYDVLKESGLPIMPHMGYQEPDPLGQAEWVKLIGLLTGHEQESNAYFAGIESRYNELKLKIENGPSPSIFSGDMKGGAWYATGGRSFLATIFRDAGADYVLKDNDDTGGVNMDFETIYAQAADVDYWRISNSFDGDFTYDVLAQQDSRFTDFKAFRERHIIYCNMSRTPFYESFPVHPDLVLSDFVHIFYPELLPDYTPTYYHLLGQ